MPSLIDRLSSAVLLATQGEWEWAQETPFEPLYVVAGTVKVCELNEWDHRPDERERDATYIALACPANVQKLIAVAKAAALLRAVEDAPDGVVVIGEPGDELRVGIHTARHRLIEALAALESP